MLRRAMGAGYGLNTWLQQRITSLIMLFIGLGIFAMIIYLSLMTNSNINSWQGIFNNLITKILVQIFFISLVIHAWTGVRDIYMDYIKSSTIKMILYILTILWLAASLIYSFKVIWII